MSNRKIEVFYKDPQTKKFEYMFTTEQYPTCKSAIASIKIKNPDLINVELKANFKE